MKTKISIIGILFFVIILGSCNNKNTTYSFGLYNSTKDTIMIDYLSYGKQFTIELLPTSENENPIIYFNYEEYSENKKAYTNLEFQNIVSNIRVYKMENNSQIEDNLTYKNEISNWKYEFDNDFFEYNHLYVLNICDTLFYFK